MAALAELEREAAHCTNCQLYRKATQTVFGEGSTRAKLMLVGEQPGDQEDRAGAPFVGPAGRLLDEVLEEAGIERKLVYVTNAVKHFKWKARGKRRIHDKPSWSEIAACRPWLEGELQAVQPRVLVPLGVSAAQALLERRSVTLKSLRGKPIEGTGLAPFVVVTYHPSAALRAPDEQARKAVRADILADLRQAADLID